MQRDRRAFSTRRVCACIIIFLSAVLLLAGSSCFSLNPFRYTDPDSQGEILLVSRSTSGDFGNGSSHGPCISADGRYVAFSSPSSNFVEGDSGEYETDTDIFRKDMETGEIILCSASSTGERGNIGSEKPSISADGRYVAFESYSSNFVPGDNNDSTDIFRKDLATGELLCCSTSASGEVGDANSELPSLSANGRYVAFQSSSGNLIPEDLVIHERGVDFIWDHLYRKDLQSGDILHCFPNSAIGEIDAAGGSPSISTDGRYIAFNAGASGLITSGSTNEYSSIVRKDFETGEISGCSRSSSGEEANGSCTSAMISADGRFVAFESDASNLTSADNEGIYNIYRKDLETGDITCCSTSTDGVMANHHCGDPSISSDGRYVTFFTASTNLGYRNRLGERRNVYRKDNLTGDITLCSCSASKEAGSGTSEYPAISADGRYVVFESDSDNLVDDDPGAEDPMARNHNRVQVYRKDLGGNARQ